MVTKGNHVVSPGVCQDLTIHISKDTFSLDCYAIPMEGFNVILVVQWLGILGSIIWDFSNMTMTFSRAGCQITWHGIPAASRSALVLACTGKGLMQELLNEFNDLFLDPHSLPLVCDSSHCIFLKFGIESINVLPYHYAQL